VLRSVRISERVLDGHAHVRGRNLCQHAAIAVFDHGVDSGLRMDHYVHLDGRKSKQPARLNHFEALVHEGSAIDGNPVAHAPGWVIERLFRSDGGKRFAWRVAKGAARSGQDEARKPGPGYPPQALMGAVMFAVHGQEFAPNSRTASITSLPPETSTSLFARPIRFPKRTAS